MVAKYSIFDVQLHAYSSKTIAEGFGGVAKLDFGLHQRTAHKAVQDEETMMSKTVGFMDRNNVSRGLLSGDNDIVQRWASRYPGRFLPSFCPDLTLQDNITALQLFETEVDQRKWHALGELGLPYAGKAVNDNSLFPYFEICERRRIPVAFHCGLDGPEPQSFLGPQFRVEFGDPLLLQDVIIRFPKLKIIIFHMGWPFFDHALYMLYAYQNIYLDTGVVNWILGESVFNRMLKEAVETTGSDRIVFGSDQMVWPQMITPAVRSIKSAKYLTDKDKKRILSENAVRLFPSDK